MIETVPLVGIEDYKVGLTGEHRGKFRMQASVAEKINLDKVPLNIMAWRFSVCLINVSHNPIQRGYVILKHKRSGHYYRSLSFGLLSPNDKVLVEMASYTMDPSIRAKAIEWFVARLGRGRNYNNLALRLLERNSEDYELFIEYWDYKGNRFLIKSHLLAHQPNVSDVELDKSYKVSFQWVHWYRFLLRLQMYYRVASARRNKHLASDRQGLTEMLDSSFGRNADLSSVSDPFPYLDKVSKMDSANK